MESVAGNHVSGDVVCAARHPAESKMPPAGVRSTSATAVPGRADFQGTRLQLVDGPTGRGCAKSTPMDVKKKGVRHDGRLNKDPGILKQMADGGFEVVDIPVDKNRLHAGAHQGIRRDGQAHGLVKLTSGFCLSAARPAQSPKSGGS